MFVRALEPARREVRAVMQIRNALIIPVKGPWAFGAVVVIAAMVLAWLRWAPTEYRGWTDTNSHDHHGARGE